MGTRPVDLESGVRPQALSVSLSREMMAGKGMEVENMAARL